MALRLLRNGGGMIASSPVRPQSSQQAAKIRSPHLTAFRIPSLAGERLGSPQRPLEAIARHRWTLSRNSGHKKAPWTGLLSLDLLKPSA